MKKLTLFVAVIAVMSLVSCKKDRVCTCTTVSSGGTVVDVTTYYESTKDDARLFCIGSQTTTTAGTTATVGDKTTCELK